MVYIQNYKNANMDPNMLLCKQKALSLNGSVVDANFPPIYSSCCCCKNHLGVSPCPLDPWVRVDGLTRLLVTLVIHSLHWQQNLSAFSSHNAIFGFSGGFAIPFYMKYSKLYSDNLNCTVTLIMCRNKHIHDQKWHFYLFAKTAAKKNHKNILHPNITQSEN